MLVLFSLRIWRPLQYCALQLSRWCCRPCARPHPAVNASNSCRCSSKRADRSTRPAPLCRNSWGSQAASRRKRSARRHHRWTRNRRTMNNATTTNRTSATCSLPPHCRSDRNRRHHRYCNKDNIVILLFIMLIADRYLVLDPYWLLFYSRYITHV